MKLGQIGFALGAAMLGGLVVGQAQPVLTVGRAPLNQGYYPFYDEAIAVIADASNLQVKYQEMPIGDLVNALAYKLIDIVSGPFGKTPDREAVADFTQPYASYRDVLITSADDTKTYKSIDDMKGMAIAVTRGSLYTQPLKQVGVNVVAVETVVEGVSVLEAGLVEGLYTTNPIGAELVSGRPKFKMVDSYPAISFTQVRLLVQKGNSGLLSKLNSGISKLKADGTLKALNDKAGYGYVP